MIKRIIGGADHFSGQGEKGIVAQPQGTALFVGVDQNPCAVATALVIGEVIAHAARKIMRFFAAGQVVNGIARFKRDQD